jgi:hypothetical protein
VSQKDACMLEGLGVARAFGTQVVLRDLLSARRGDNLA